MSLCISSKKVSLVISLLALFQYTSLRPVAPAEDQNLYAEMVNLMAQRLHRHVLPNGVTLLCLPYENTNYVCLGAAVACGSADEGPDEHGLAHLVSHLLFRASVGYPEGALREIESRFGVTVAPDQSSHVGQRGTTYQFQSDESNWPVFADLLAALLQQPVFSAEALREEQVAVIQEVIERSADAPCFGSALLMPPNHPASHGVYGYKERIAEYRLAEVTSFYNKKYTGPRTTLLAWGAIRPDDFFTWAQQACRHFSSEEMPEGPIGRLPSYAGLSRVHKVIVNQKGETQVLFVWQTPSVLEKESICFELLGHCLRQRLRYKMLQKEAVCADVGVHIQKGTPFSSFYVYVSPLSDRAVSAPDFDDFRQIVQEEISLLATEGPTAQESAAFYQESLADVAAYLEQPFHIFHNLHSFAACGDLLIERDVARPSVVAAASRQSVALLAAEWLREATMHTFAWVPLPPEYASGWGQAQQLLDSYNARLLNSILPVSVVSAKVPPVQLSISSRKEARAETLGLIEEGQTKTGLKIYCRAVPEAVTCAVSLVLRDAASVGAGLVQAGDLAASQVAPHALLRSVPGFTQESLSAACACQGVHISVSGGVVTACGLKNKLSAVFEVLAKVLRAPVVTPAVVDEGRQAAISSLKESVAGHCGPHWDFLFKALYPGAPESLSLEARIAAFDHVTPAAVEKVLSLMTDPSRVALVVCGPAPAVEVFAEAEKAFSYFAPSVYGLPVVEKPTLFQTPVIKTIEGGECAEVIAFCQTDNCREEEIFALECIVHNLRFFLPAHVTVALVPASAQYHGSLQVLFSGPGITLEQARKMLAAAGENVLAPGITLADLERMKGTYALNHAGYVQTPALLAHRLAREVARGVPVGSTVALSIKIATLTVDMVNEVQRKYADINRWSFVSVGPCSGGE